MAYKLNSPHEWLLESAQRWGRDALYRALSGLVHRLDDSSIYDQFQSEMDAEGYTELKPNKEPSDAESWGSHRWHT